jgi:hypothetical protein
LSHKDLAGRWGRKSFGISHWSGRARARNRPIPTKSAQNRAGIALSRCYSVLKWLMLLGNRIGYPAVEVKGNHHGFRRALGQREIPLLEEGARSGVSRVLG